MKRRRSSRRLDPQGDLMLAAMVDMMVNVLLFILMLYGTGPVEWAGPIELPTSTSEASAEQPVRVAISVQGVAVEGERVLNLEDHQGWPTLPSDSAPGLATLRDKLSAHRPPDEAKAVLAIEIDRRVPWSAIQPVLAVVGDAGYADVQFFASRATTKTPVPVRHTPPG